MAISRDPLSIFARFPCARERRLCDLARLASSRRQHVHFRQPQDTSRRRAESGYRLQLRVRQVRLRGAACSNLSASAGRGVRRHESSSVPELRIALYSVIPSNRLFRGSLFVINISARSHTTPLFVGKKCRSSLSSIVLHEFGNIDERPKEKRECNFWTF